MVRIRGLVREARRAQEAIRDGVPREERSRFLGRAQEAVRFVERLLAEEGADEGALPPVSRNAYALLRRVAAIPASEIPEPRPGEAPRGRLPAKNVVAALEGPLRALEGGAADAAARERVRDDAGFWADSVEAFCRDNEAEPRQLAPRSRAAHAMLRWLSVRENVERYAEQVARVLRVVPRALERLEVVAPSRTVVRFEPGRLLWRVRDDADVLRWRLSIGFLAAEEADLDDLVSRVYLRSHAGSAWTRVQAFCDSEDFAALVAELDLAANPPSEGRGRVHDLGALFERLDAAFFHGTLPRPRLEWLPMVTRRLFGFHSAARDLVALNPVLDDPAVPAEVVEAILYHELLHKKHGTRLSGLRRHVHTPEFRADERLHPGHEAALRWMHSVAAGLGADDAATRGPEGDDAPAEAVRCEPLASARLVDPEADVPRRSDAPGRNEPCWCGSGRKYKRCHLASDEGSVESDEA